MRKKYIEKQVIYVEYNSLNSHAVITWLIKGQHQRIISSIFME